MHIFIFHGLAYLKSFETHFLAAEFDLISNITILCI